MMQNMSILHWNRQGYKFNLMYGDVNMFATERKKYEKLTSVISLYMSTHGKLVYQNFIGEIKLFEM